MKWLKLNEVRKAARGTELDRLRSSRRHWYEMWTAPEQELRRKYRQTQNGLASDYYCALCAAHYKKDFCPLLNRLCEGYCTRMYGKANDAICDWYYRGGSFEHAREKIGVVYHRLDQLVKRYEKKAKK